MLTPTVNKRIQFPLLLISLGLLIFSILLVFIIYDNRMDEAVFDAIAPQITPERTSLMKAISFLGNHSFLVPANVLFIIFLLVKKNKKAAVTAGVTALSSLGIMSLLKHLTSRHRPAGPLVEGITNFAYPSGHAFMSVAFYGLIIWWVAVSIKDKLIQRLVISLLLLLILLIGFSRIYLRVHYTTDVIAGFCMSIIWLTICWWLMNKFTNRSTKH